MRCFMTEQKKVERGGAGSAETSHITADPAPARSLDAAAADVSGWRDARDEEIDRLRARVGEITMDNELLYEKIAMMEASHPFGRRRSK